MNHSLLDKNNKFLSIIPFNQLPAFIFGLCTIIYMIGLCCIDVLEVDSAQYASMSLQMLQENNYLQVKCRELNYLDKPPLIFWLSSLFYKIFGVSHFTFRLPSFLFTILGTYSTFKLGELLYDRKTGLIAALVIYSCQAFFLFNHDVRTDCLLTNSVIFAIWQLYAHIKFNKLKNFILGFIGIALAMLAKGPIGIVVPAFALGSHLLIKKDFKTIFKLKWIAGIILVLIILSPMVYGLYVQHGMKGVRFFFWTQSFGRITGESEWKNGGDGFFFIHTFLWSFLPWTIFAIGGILIKLKELLNTTTQKKSEFITLAGFLLTFTALSFSRYMLPHYIFVIYPLAALFTAKYINDLLSNKISVFSKNITLGFQWFIILVLAIFPPLIFTWVFPTNKFYVWLIYTAFILIIIYLIFKKELKEKIIYISLFSIINVNFLLNLHVYPTLLTYQSNSVAGKILAELNIPKNNVVFFNTEFYAFEFYFQSRVKWYNRWEQINQELDLQKELWVYSDEKGYNEIKSKQVSVLFEKKLDDISVANLTITFLNPNTREQAVRYRYLIKIKKI